MESILKQNPSNILNIKKIPQKVNYWHVCNCFGRGGGIDGGNIWQIIIDGLFCICVWNNVHRNVIVGVISRFQQGCLKTSRCRSKRYEYVVGHTNMYDFGEHC